MTDPYRVLGVSPNASMDEIKNAYRELARKYHPDHYGDNPLSDLAETKMKEINEAYDAILQQHAKGNAGANGYAYSGNGQANSRLGDIRAKIASGRIDDAEMLLDGIPMSARDAEWYFLKGSIQYKRGWLEEAYKNFETANRMNPNNPEYSAAFQQMNHNRTGGYRTSSAGGCSGCDICTSLVCADCCCECMGGDLIPCC